MNNTMIRISDNAQGHSETRTPSAPSSPKATRASNPTAQSASAARVTPSTSRSNGCQTSSQPSSGSRQKRRRHEADQN